MPPVAFKSQIGFNLTPSDTPINPLKEVAAYEALWAIKNTTFRSLANLFSQNPGSRPSDFVEIEKIDYFTSIIKSLIHDTHNLNVIIDGTFDYPPRLKEAKEPVELLYFTGILEYLRTRCFSIVGTRTPSLASLRITREIATNLVRDGYTIVSGLAAGIDTQAHKSAIKAEGRTIGVIGTPLNKIYPKENSNLQKKIAEEHLLISQVPFYQYSKQPYFINKNFFLERNKTMSALSEGTLIVEAGETSGSLTQAVAAVDQKRKLFIWETCFKKNLTWPQKFADKGAFRVSSYEEIRTILRK